MVPQYDVKELCSRQYVDVRLFFSGSLSGLGGGCEVSGPEKTGLRLAAPVSMLSRWCLGGRNGTIIRIFSARHGPRRDVQRTELRARGRHDYLVSEIDSSGSLGA